MFLDNIAIDIRYCHGEDFDVESHIDIISFIVQFEYPWRVIEFEIRFCSRGQRLEQAQKWRQVGIRLLRSSRSY